MDMDVDVDATFHIHGKPGSIYSDYRRSVGLLGSVFCNKTMRHRRRPGVPCNQYDAAAALAWRMTTQ